MRTLEGHEDRVYCVAVTPDGKQIVSGSRDRTVRVWEFASGKPLNKLTDHTSFVTAVAVTPDNALVVSASWDRSVRVWELRTGNPVAAFTCESGFHVCAAAPDSRHIVCGELSGRVLVLRLEGMPDAELGDAATVL